MFENMNIPFWVIWATRVVMKNSSILLNYPNFELLSSYSYGQNKFKIPVSLILYVRAKKLITYIEVRKVYFFALNDCA